jgi:hypothetical protein
MKVVVVSKNGVVDAPMKVRAGSVEGYYFLYEHGHRNAGCYAITFPLEAELFKATQIYKCKTVQTWQWVTETHLGVTYHDVVCKACQICPACGVTVPGMSQEFRHRVVPSEAAYISAVNAVQLQFHDNVYLDQMDCMACLQRQANGFMGDEYRLIKKSTRDARDNDQFFLAAGEPDGQQLVFLELSQGYAGNATYTIEGEAVALVTGKSMGAGAHGTAPAPCIHVYGPCRFNWVRSGRLNVGETNEMSALWDGQRWKIGPKTAFPGRL